MLDALKQFGEKDIGFLSGRFRTARIHLTAVYVTILAIILFLSSSSIYSAFSSQLQRRFSRFHPRAYITLPDGLVAPSLTDVQADLITSLFFVNGLLLVVAGVSSYWLAGATLRPIQASYERQRRFLGDASHELRTPLAILQTDLENERAETTQSATKMSIDSYLEEVERMRKIVANLLTLSRLDESTVSTVPLAVTDIRTFVEDSVQRFQGLATREGMSLVLAPLPQEAMLVQVEKDLFFQAVGNLIANALAYNSPQGTVTVSLEKRGNQACLQISDTGIGIAKEDLQKIFDRFYRVDRSRSRQTGGSGLGLAIVQGVMNQFQGTIEITSVVGKGTKVMLLFPLVAAS
jgi:two-component system OmpR family sensor kinase